VDSLSNHIVYLSVEIEFTMDANHHHHHHNHHDTHHHLEMEFYCAVTAGNLEVVDRLLAHDERDPMGPSVNLVTTQSYAGHSILHGACSIHRPGVVHALLQRAPIRRRLLNLPDQRHGRTPLQTCIVTKHDDLALLLLQQGNIRVHHLDNDQRNALHLACYYNSAPTVIRTLVRNMKNNTNGTNGSSASILHRLHKPDVFGKSPLLYAADHGNVTIVRTLLSYSDASTTAGCVWEWELSHVRGMAQVPNYQAVACLLLDAGIEIRPHVTAEHPYKIHTQLMQWLHHQQHDDMAQQLRTAAARGNISKLQSLLMCLSSDEQISYESSSSSSSTTTTTTTTTTLTDPTKHVTIASYFIHQVSPAPSRCTALDCAARYGSVAAIALLLEAAAGRASPLLASDQDSYVHIPKAMQLAATYGHLSVVEELLRHTLMAAQNRWQKK